MKTGMDQQIELLKLIVQKMDIKTEDDDNDEASVQNINGDSNANREIWNSNIKNTRLRNMVLKQFLTQNYSGE
jgi:hypothetical protein